MEGGRKFGRFRKRTDPERSTTFVASHVTGHREERAYQMALDPRLNLKVTRIIRYQCLTRPCENNDVMIGGTPTLTSFSYRTGPYTWIVMVPGIRAERVIKLPQRHPI